MKAIFLFLSLLGFLYAGDGVKKVVFDLTTGDSAVLKQKIFSGISFDKSYYEGKLEDLQVAVVIHGDAYKFFVKDLQKTPYAKDSALQQEQADISKRIQSLHSLYNVEFLICASGMKHKNIDPQNVPEYIKIIPNASIGLIDKQNEGYAYIPVAH